MPKILSPKFFQGRNTVKIAKSLLGKFLMRRYKIPRKSAFSRRKSARCEAAMITEVEAYDGFRDKASHAHRGKTERNRVMFGPAGYWYVYFTYGMHWMLNIVTGPQCYPAAVLIRGVAADQRRIGRGITQKKLNGPAKLTKALKINGRMNGQSASKKSGLWIENGGVKIKPNQIKNAPRVGVAYAGPFWAKKHYRFMLKSD